MKVLPGGWFEVWCLRIRLAAGAKADGQATGREARQRGKHFRDRWCYRFVPSWDGLG